MSSLVIERLTQLLASVRLALTVDPVSGTGRIRWEKRDFDVAALPLDDLDEDAMAGELLAVAAGLEAAIKAPGRVNVPGEALRDGVKALLPRVERGRFVAAYDAVKLGLGLGPEARLLHAPLGGGLVAVHVEDEGWKFTHFNVGRYASWDTTIGTVTSAARSNLYHREALDHLACEVRVGDGYDAGRLVLVDDVYYDRGGPDGVEVAVPHRDLLMIAPPGGSLSRPAVRQAYDRAAYPISPAVFVSHRGSLRLAD
jgi:hypothetical protein